MKPVEVRVCRKQKEASVQISLHPELSMERRERALGIVERAIAAHHFASKAPKREMRSMPRPDYALSLGALGEKSASKEAKTGMILLENLLRFEDGKFSYAVKNLAEAEAVTKKIRDALKNSDLETRQKPKPEEQKPLEVVIKAVTDGRNRQFHQIRVQGKQLNRFNPKQLDNIRYDLDTVVDYFYPSPSRSERLSQPYEVKKPELAETEKNMLPYGHEQKARRYPTSLTRDGALLHEVSGGITEAETIAAAFIGVLKKRGIEAELKQD